MRLNPFYVETKQELLKELLKGHSTSAVSRKLGYSFDQVKRWLDGRKELRWDEFCDLCEVLNLPLKKAITSVFLILPEELDEAYGFVGQLKQHMPKESLRSLADQLKINASVLKRYFRGEVYPPLEFVLQMIDLNANLLGSFVLELVGHAQLTPLHQRFQKSLDEVQMALFNPITPAIEGLLAIEEYKALPSHDPHWFCQKLGITEQEYEQAWQSILSHKRVAPDRSKFKLSYNTINTSGVPREQFAQLAEFWTERARQRFAGGKPSEARRGPIPALLGYRIVPMSKASSLKAMEILNEAFAQILALAEKDQGPYEDVRVFLAHSFSVSDRPPVETEASEPTPSKPIEQK